MKSQHKKSEQIALQIEKAIIGGRYKPGDRLPPERILAEEYGVSRSILREAMNHIAGLGLVRTEDRSGTYVTDYSKEASLDLLVYLMDNNETLDPEIFNSLLDFRELLELGSAHRAAARSDDAFVERLQRRLGSMKSARNDHIRLAARDYEFHAEIISQTGNIAFRILFNACKSVYLFYTEEFYKIPEHIDHTFDQLERLIEAFRAGDAPGAVEALKQALVYGRESINQSLGITGGSL